MRRTRAIVPARQTALLPPAELAQAAREFADAAYAKNTTRAYASQWRTFETWCEARGINALPTAPEALAAYLTERAHQGMKVSTLEQAIAAIARKHLDRELPEPHRSRKVKVVWKGIRRKLGVAKKQAAPVNPDALRRMVRACKGPDIACLRDAALLLVGFAGALRREEIVGLDVSHALFVEDGLILRIEHSKGDQEGKGVDVAVPFGSDKLTCPVRTLKTWLEASGIEDGAIFRGVRHGGKLTGKRLDPGDVVRILKRSAKRAGLKVEQLSGHSLRAGLGTTAAKQGKRLEVIQKHMRHKRLDQTSEYVRAAHAFDEDDNAASGIGL